MEGFSSIRVLNDDMSIVNVFILKRSSEIDKAAAGSIISRELNNVMDD